MVREFKNLKFDINLFTSKNYLTEQTWEQKAVYLVKFMSLNLI